MNFIFSPAPKIYFGEGKFKELPKLLKEHEQNIKEHEQNILLVTGAKFFKETEYYQFLKKTLKQNNHKIWEISVSSEPSPKIIDEAVKEYATKVDIVVSVGGGSVIDAGKAISAMLYEKAPVIQYLEKVGKGKKHSGKKVPFIAVPTTAGTGSEATKNAVLSEHGEDGFKASLRHDNFIPDMAIVDPSLMMSCPKATTAACGLDAFTQLLEAYVSNKSNIMTDALALSGLYSCRDNLVLAATTGSHDIKVRTHMAYASLVSGIVLANAGLGVVHGFASVLGGLYNIAHGVICGKLLPSATEETIKKLKQEQNEVALRKYATVGYLLDSGKPGNDKDIEHGCALLVQYCNRWLELLEIPSLSTLSCIKIDVEKVIEKTGNKNNPAVLDKGALKNILLRCL